MATLIGSGTPSHWSDALPESVLYPAGMQKGDLAVLQVRVNSNSSAETWSPGAAGFQRRAVDAFSGGTQWVYTRIADGAEPVNVNVEFSGTAAKSARMYLFRAQRGSSLIDLEVRNGTGSTISHDDVRTHASGRLAIALVSYAATTAASSFTGETGGNWQEQAEASSGTGGNRTIQLQTADMTAGTLSGGTFSVTSPGTWVVHTFAIADANASQSVHARVSVEDPDGIMRDLRTLVGKDWQISVSYEHDIDAPVSSASVRLFRSNNPTQSLAPLMSASTINRDAALQFAPFLHASRRITIETAVIESGGSQPFADEWRLAFDGHIDRVDSGGDLFVTVSARDLGGVLQTEWIQTVTTYGDDGGAKTAHAVIQDILNGWITNPPTLYVPTAPVPPVLIHEYDQQKMSVMDAIKAVANNHGWDVRYLFDEGTGQWRLTYFEPERDTTEIAGAYSDDLYTIVNTLAIGVEDIRNDISVIYTDGTTGEPEQITVDDPVSIAKWGGLSRFAEFEFGPDSPIDTASEATDLANAALSDLSEPFAEQEVQTPFDPDLDIGRLYEFLGNDEQYDETQRFAPSRVTHELSPEDSTTTAFMRGKVAGQFKTWLRGEVGTKPRDGADGLTTEFRFRCSTTQPPTPTGEDPAGWTIQPPPCVLPSVLWQSSVQRSPRTGLTVGPWTTPVRMTGEQGPPGEDGTEGPIIRRIWNTGGEVTTNVFVQLVHSENDGGTLEMWVNPSGTSSPNPEGPADGSVSFVSTPFLADNSTVFGGAGLLLNNVPVSALEKKTVFARFTDSQGRVATLQADLQGIIQVIDPFGILQAVDPDALVTAYALKLVTNPNLDERAVSYRNLVVGSYDNLISDPLFEAAGDFEADGETAAAAFNQAGWTQVTDSGGAWGLTTTNPAAGAYAAIYNRSGQIGDGLLFASGLTGSNAITAKAGDRHYFQARARESGAGSGGQVEVVIQYRGGGGSLLDSHTSDPVNLTTTYQTIAITVPEDIPAPAGTAAVRFGLRVLNVGTSANVLWDDCFARLMVDGTLIVDGSILAKHISAGSITTPLLAARAATFEKVSIGSLGNMIPDPIFSSGDLTESDWTVHVAGGGTWSISGGATRAGDFAASYNRTGQTNFGRLRHAPRGMEATEGDEFYFRAYARAASGTGEGGVAIIFRDATGSVVGAALNASVTLDTTYQLIDVDTSPPNAPAPAGTTRVDFALDVQDSGSTTVVRFDDCYAQKKVDGTLYVDGSIIGRHLGIITVDVARWIQSTGYVAATSGWRIDGDGNAEFNNVTVRGVLDGVTGTFAGNLTAGSLTIDSGTITFTDTDVNFAATNLTLEAAGGTSALALVGSLGADINIISTGGDIRLNPGIGGGLSFFGVAPVTKPTVTGGDNGVPALMSLLDALDALGLITDNST